MLALAYSAFIWFQSVFALDAKTVSGAVVVAAATSFIAIIVALLTYITRSIASWVKARLTNRKLRRAILIKFFIFVKIRQHNCATIFSQDRRKGSLSLLRPKMKMYVSLGKETDDYDIIAGISQNLPHDLQLSIRFLSEHDRLLLAQYSKTGTDDFEALPVPRKIAAINNLFDAGAAVVTLASAVVDGLKRYRYLEKLEAQIDARLAKL